MKLYFDNPIISLDDLAALLSPVIKLPSALLGNKIFELTQGKAAKLETGSLSIDNLVKHRLKGIDIPIWCVPEKQKSALEPLSMRKIMIVGQEPFRTEHDFAAGDFYKDIVLSTPFGIHLQSDIRLRRRLGVYWEIINSLATEHFLYVSDYCKIWFEDFNRHSAALLSTNDSVLEAEIKIIDPDIIITFGNSYIHLIEERFRISSLKIPKEGFECKSGSKTYRLIPLLHPSGTAGKYRRCFFESNGIDNTLPIAERYVRLVNKFLNG